MEERHIKSKSKARKLRKSYTDGYESTVWDSEKEKKMQTFIGTKIIKASPAPCVKDIHNSKLMYF